MESEIKTFRDLIVWQKGVELCQSVYELTRAFPDAERYGLTSQIRRAAVSVPSNIAEGYARRSKRDYLRYLNIAFGSLCELETQLIIAVRLGITNGDAAGPCMTLVRDVDRLLNALIRAVKNSCAQPEKKTSG